MGQVARARSAPDFAGTEPATPVKGGGTGARFFTQGVRWSRHGRWHGCGHALFHVKRRRLSQVIVRSLLFRPRPRTPACRRGMVRARPRDLHVGRFDGSWLVLSSAKPGIITRRTST